MTSTVREPSSESACSVRLLVSWLASLVGSRTVLSEEAFKAIHALTMQVQGEHSHWDQKDGELFLVRLKVKETPVEVCSNF